MDLCEHLLYGVRMAFSVPFDENNDMEVERARAAIDLILNYYPEVGVIFWQPAGRHLFRLVLNWEVEVWMYVKRIGKRHQRVTITGWKTIRKGRVDT